jgi:hypothetical protein
VEARRVHFKRADQVELELLAADMREGDRLEIQATSGRAPLLALRKAVRWSRRHGGDAWTGYIDGRVAAVFGIGKRALLSPAAYPWCLTSSAVDRAPRLFYRASRAVLASFLEEHQELEQFVDARYVQALRWVERLGFTLEPARPFGVAGLPFHRITIRRETT